MNNIPEMSKRPIDYGLYGQMFGGDQTRTTNLVRHRVRARLDARPRRYSCMINLMNTFWAGNPVRPGP